MKATTDANATAQTALGWRHMDGLSSRRWMVVSVLQLRVVEKIGA